MPCIYKTAGKRGNFLTFSLFQSAILEMECCECHGETGQAHSLLQELGIIKQEHFCPQLKEVKTGNNINSKMRLYLT